MFQELLSNLTIENAEQISLRYDQITACLNKIFRETKFVTAILTEKKVKVLL